MGPAIKPSTGSGRICQRPTPPNDRPRPNARWLHHQANRVAPPQAFPSHRAAHTNHLASAWNGFCRLAASSRPFTLAGLHAGDRLAPPPGQFRASRKRQPPLLGKTLSALGSGRIKISYDASRSQLDRLAALIWEIGGRDLTDLKTGDRRQGERFQGSLPVTSAPVKNLSCNTPDRVPTGAV